MITRQVHLVRFENEGFFHHLLLEMLVLMRFHCDTHQKIPKKKIVDVKSIYYRQ